jgi:ribonuclease HI
VNPGGIGAYGYVIEVDGKVLIDGNGIIGEGRSISNNVAEYEALIHLLEKLIELGMKNDVLVMGDSQLVINQMSGAWNAKGGLYLESFKSARVMATAFTGLKFKWVPREQNAMADRLSREAYEQHCKDRGIPAKYMVKTKSFEETKNVLMESRETKPDIILQDEMPVLKGNPSVLSSTMFPNVIDDVGKLSPEQVKALKSCMSASPVRKEPSVIVVGTPGSGMSITSRFSNYFNQVPKPATGETCETCKWLKWKGPHVGCFPNGKYRKWLSKSFIKTNKCEQHAPLGDKQS